LLPQTCVHWGKFLAAASRRSLGRVSVPVCLVVLSDQGPVTGLVGRYPTNYLMGRRLVPERLAPFFGCPTVCGIVSSFDEVSPTPGLIPTCSSAVRHAAGQARCVRLACIRHAASVRPEPGSNSALCCVATSCLATAVVVPHAQNHTRLARCRGWGGDEQKN
jgi:hypothetical protein